MLNENTYKIIDMEMLILQHKQGHLSEDQLIEKCQAILRGVDNKSELATIVW
jgi:hypothetical protein